MFKNDNEWYTNEKDIEFFLNNITIPKDKIIWCPFDKENSAFVKVLKRGGYNVVFSHIDNNQDFYNYEPKQYDIILSNPPFKNKLKLIKRIKELNKPFALIFGIQAFNSSGFVKELKDIENLSIVFLTRRISFWKNDPNEKQTRPNFHSLWIIGNLINDKLLILEN